MIEKHSKRNNASRGWNEELEFKWEEKLQRFKSTNKSLNAEIKTNLSILPIEHIVYWIIGRNEKCGWEIRKAMNHRESELEDG